jgi:hypothetical protein
MTKIIVDHNPDYKVAHPVHLADMSERSYISIQVVPASAGAHIGLACAFMTGTAQASGTAATPMQHVRLPVSSAPCHRGDP